MKKLLLVLTIITVLLAVCQNSFAALSSAIVWEVRTTGNANNGGGYKTGATGTDFSQQDAAQYSLTSLTTAAANAIILTASAADDMVGNIINITGGTNFTAGRYEITAVSVGVSITVDRNCTTDVGAAGTAVIGGAVDHPGRISTAIVAGHKTYIAGGTYVKIGSNAYVLDISVTGTTTAPVYWIGYIAGTARTQAYTTDRPVFDGATNTTNCIEFSDTASNVVKNIWCKRASSDGIVGGNSSSVNITLVNVKSSNNGGDGLAGGHQPNLIDCEFNNNASDGVSTNSSASWKAFGCYSHDNTAKGFENVNSLSFYALFCIADSNGSHGFIVPVCSIFNCLAYNNTGTTDGFNLSANSSLYVLYNNIAMSNGRYGFNRVSSSSYVVGDYNLYNGNGTAGLNGITAGDHDLTSDPLFTDAAGGDFTFSSSSSPAIGTGFPQSMPGATGDYNWNIGIDQGDHGTGGTTTTNGRGARICAGIGG